MAPARCCTWAAQTPAALTTTRAAISASAGACGAQRGVAGERQLVGEAEDAYPVVGIGGGGRQHEGAFREVRPHRDAAQVVVRQSLGVEHDRERVAAEVSTAEDVDLTEGAVGHRCTLPAASLVEPVETPPLVELVETSQRWSNWSRPLPFGDPGFRRDDAVQSRPLAGRRDDGLGVTARMRASRPRPGTRRPGRHRPGVPLSG